MQGRSCCSDCDEAVAESAVLLAGVEAPIEDWIELGRLTQVLSDSSLAWVQAQSLRLHTSPALSPSQL